MRLSFEGGLEIPELAFKLDFRGFGGWPNTTRGRVTWG
jgi:hypothetical protein